MSYSRALRFIRAVLDPKAQIKPYPRADGAPWFRVFALYEGKRFVYGEGSTPELAAADCIDFSGFQEADPKNLVVLDDSNPPADLELVADATSVDPVTVGVGACTADVGPEKTSTHVGTEGAQGPTGGSDVA